jgi:hypothetical protein
MVDKGALEAACVKRCEIKPQKFLANKVQENMYRNCLISLPNFQYESRIPHCARTTVHTGTVHTTGGQAF